MAHGGPSDVKMLRYRSPWKKKKRYLSACQLSVLPRKGGKGGRDAINEAQRRAASPRRTTLRGKREDCDRSIIPS